MNRQDLFERTLASLYAGMLSDAEWPATSGLIDEICGIKGNFLAFGDEAVNDDIDIFFARFCYRGQRHAALEQEYFGSWHAVDERLPRIRTLPDSQLAPTPSLLSEDELKTSAVYNELMVRADARDSLNVRLDGPGGSRIVWTLADPVDREGWTSDRVGAVERLLPHVRQFVRARQALVGARALGASAVELLDNVRVGIVQLDRRGRLVVANDRTHALLRRGDGLADRDGRLHASLPKEDAVLQRLLAQALHFPGRPGVGGSMLVSRPHSPSRLVLDPERVGDALGLTRTESWIAVLLAQGKSIDEVAAETGRQRTTVKWHIRHIYGKCQISRRIELVQLVMSLTDVPGVRDYGPVRPGRSLARPAAVNPMYDAGREPDRGGAGALVLVIDPTDRTDLDPERVGDALGLTRTESWIAVLLAQGKSIDEVAAETGRQRTTVKWHIRHIYGKCQISRRIELVQLVMSLTDVPGVRDYGPVRPGRS